MSLTVMEGFDHVTNGDDLLGKWDNAEFATVNSGRFGGNGASFNTGDRLLELDPGDPGTTNSLIIGIAMKFNAALNADVIQFFDGTDEMGAIEIQTDGTFRYMVGGGELLESSAGHSFGEWVYLEVKVLFDNGSGEIAFKINGQGAGSSTGVDTLNAGTACDRFTINGVVMNPTTYDDIYMGDTSGGFDFLSVDGQTPRINTLPPTSDNAVAFTATEGDNHSGVDETGGPDDNSTYNESDTTTERDTFGYDASGIAVGSVIFAVGLNTQAVKTSAGAVDIRNVTLSGASTGLSGSIRIPAPRVGVSSALFTRAFSLEDQDPDGSVDWEVASVDAAKFGYERV